MDKTKMISLLIAISLFFSFPLLPCSPTSANEDLVQKTILVIWDVERYIDTPTIYEGGRIYINCTVLPISSSSVNLTRDTEGDPIYIWDPSLPYNQTIAIGESFTNIYTLVNGQSDIGLITFNVFVTTPGMNATILWQYQILEMGTPGLSSFGFLASLFILTGLSLSVRVIMTKKRTT